MEAFLVLFLFLIHSAVAAVSSEEKSRYILYDVNPGEGFNLRRDVFGRMGVFVKKLNAGSKVPYVLVLPPWDHLYHWQSTDVSSQRQIPWGSFFNLEGISRYVPVIEFSEFLAKNGPVIEATYYLQAYKEGWSDGEFEEKWDIRDCLETNRYRKTAGDNLYSGYFWGFRHVRSRNFSCLSVQGSSHVISDLVKTRGSRSIMLDRAENLLHDWFGDEEYWAIRRATRFSSQLMSIANEFRSKYLDSSDEKDDTIMEDLWEEFKPERSESRGGPYIGAHLRRKDFLNSRSDKLPSLKGAAEQLRKKLNQFALDKLFIATDAPDHEFQTLKSHLPEFQVLKFKPSPEMKEDIKDGGVAIVDQIIASRARYFIGSHESTFTFRIQEEREILGFQVKNTFDILCRDGVQDKCSKGSIWKIVYPKSTKAFKPTLDKPIDEL